VLAVSAASFLYTGLADLIPSIHGHSRMKTGVGPFAALLAGVAIIVALRGLHH
jgi:zinc transporter ZupT